MAWKNGFGIILVLVGFFLVIAQPFSPTGAVIDLSTSSAKVSFGIGLVMIIAGILMILAEKGKEMRASYSKRTNYLSIFLFFSLIPKA